MAITTGMYPGMAPAPNLAESYGRGKTMGQMIKRGNRDEEEYEKKQKMRDVMSTALKSGNMESLYDPATLGGIAEHSPETAVGLIQNKAKRDMLSKQYKQKMDDRDAANKFREKQFGLKKSEFGLKEKEFKSKWGEGQKPFSESKKFEEYKTKKLFDKSLKDRKDDKTPKQRLSSLSAEARNKIGSMASAIRALSQMQDASNKGQGPRRIGPDTTGIGSFISDTDYTKAERVLAEVTGRLQSGGAIQKEELLTFKAMGPRPGDSDSIRNKKIRDQFKFIENKIKAFGLSTEDLKSAGLDVGGDMLNLITGKQQKKEVPKTQPINIPGLGTTTADAISAELKRRGLAPSVQQ